MNVLSPKHLKKTYLILVPGRCTPQRNKFDLKYHMPLPTINFYLMLTMILYEFQASATNLEPEI